MSPEGPSTQGTASRSYQRMCSLAIEYVLYNDPSHAHVTRTHAHKLVHIPMYTHIRGALTGSVALAKERTHRDRDLVCRDTQVRGTFTPVFGAGHTDAHTYTDAHVDMDKQIYTKTETHTFYRP